MRHRITKLKVKAGIDANRMLLRKLVVNFVNHGKMVTTEKKAKILKVHLDSLLQKTKEENQANTNYLLSKLGSAKFVKTLYKQVGPTLKGRTGGYVKVQRLHRRLSDGAPLAQVSWSMPVVIEVETVAVPVSTVQEPLTEDKKELEAKVTKTKAPKRAKKA